MELFMHRKGGFSTIELMVTLIILSIVAAIAIPGFSRWLPNYRLKTAARDLYSTFQLARMKAVRANGEYAVLFHPGSGLYQVISAGPDGHYSTGGDNETEKAVFFSTYGGDIGYGHGNAGAPLDAVRGFDNGVTFNDSAEGNDIVVFNSRGLINEQVNSGGEAYVSNTNNVTYAIGVGPSGVVTLQKWHNGAWE
jgi:prepilin-type N-terminal cleavage/methylation domain-containing protein